MLTNEQHHLPEYTITYPKPTKNSNGTYDFSGVIFQLSGDRYKKVDNTEQLDVLTGQQYKDKGIWEPMIERLSGAPLHVFDPMKDIEAYAKHRMITAASLLLGTRINEGNNLAEYRASILKALRPGRHYFAVMALDIVNSTDLAITLGNEQYSKIARTIELEAANWSAKFGGVHLKFVGDGAIVGFAEHKVMYVLGEHELCTNPVSRCLAAASIIRAICAKWLLKVLAGLGMPDVHIRIGIDYGEVDFFVIEEIEDPFGLEFHGATINIASKLQATSDPWQITIGEDAVKNLPSYHIGMTFGRRDLRASLKRANGMPYREFSYLGDSTVNVDNIISELEESEG